MRKIVASMLMALDGVVENPQMWTVQFRSEESQKYKEESGAISIEPLMRMAIWWIRGSREKRDMDAAKRFFEHALALVGHAPKQVTTDGHTSYPRAIREIMGTDVQHRTSKSLTKRLEQDHRGSKQR